jgi:putative transposase
MGLRKTFQYKAVVNQSTSAHATHWLHLCQQLYNLCLEQRCLIYKHRKEFVSKYDQINELPDLKAGCPEFKAVGSQVLQEVVERVDKAFQGFFSRLKTKKGKAGFPRFKGRDRYDSFTLKQSGWKLHGKYLEVTGVGTFKLFLSRPIEGKIKTVTIKRTSWGAWYVSFSCENVPAKAYPLPVKEKTGIDVNLVNYCTDSDPESEAVENPRYYVKSQKQLRRRQRKASRRKKGSKRHRKAQIQVAKTHAKVARQRKDFLHKTANHYITGYQVIGIEDLKVANMKRNHRLAKHISDAGWSTFFQLLVYKAEEAGRQVVKVKPHFSSQECSQCHVLVPKALSQRVHNCWGCGFKIDRDKNSANIIESRVGQTLQTLT